MTQFTETTTAAETVATIDPTKERARIYRLIRNGILPRYKIEVTKVQTGPHPKQHRLNFRLVSTMALLMKGIETSKEST